MPTNKAVLYSHSAIDLVAGYTKPVEVYRIWVQEG